MHPENIIRNEVQEIEDVFLSNLIDYTIIQPSQDDSEEVAPAFSQPDYIQGRIK